MYILLKSTEGPYKGKSKKVPLKSPKYECVLGRTISADEFRLDQDPEISGHHLTFKWNLERDCLQVRDEKSFNGTALNLKILKPGVYYDVKNNSVLNLGKSKFTVVIIDEKQSKTESSKNVAPPEKKEENLYCPVCYKDISKMTEVGRTQHVNNCIPEKRTAPSIVEKAQQFTRSLTYQEMSLKELTALKLKMEDIRASLEIEYQKVQKVFYQKRAEEVLNNTVNRGSRKRESYSKAMEMIYSVPEEEEVSSNQKISKIQAQLTGSVENPNAVISESDSLCLSEDSILSQNEMSTPIKTRRVTMSPSKGIAHINPRRSSILVSPSKPCPVVVSRLNPQERNQRLQFYLQQMPPDLKGLPSTELQNQIAQILNRSVEEIDETIQSLSDQIEQCENPQPVLSFLYQIASDLKVELEAIRPTEIRRQSIYEEKSSLFQSPRKSLFKSPAKKLERIEISEDTIARIHAAIEKDKNLQYIVESKQVVSFERLVSCIRKSLPTISIDVIQNALDRENILYVKCSQ